MNKIKPKNPPKNIVFHQQKVKIHRSSRSASSSTLFRLVDGDVATKHREKNEKQTKLFLNKTKKFFRKFFFDKFRRKNLIDVFELNVVLIGRRTSFSSTSEDFRNCLFLFHSFRLLKEENR